MLRTVRATRYVTPLREGGSLPAIVEADDLGFYVVKFRGAGQGPLALVAEILGGEIGRALGLRVPELVLIDIDPALGRNEPDYEIRELLNRSVGLNLAMDYLPGSVMFDPAARDTSDPEIASRAVWFDAFITNIDRTPRNPNLLRWHKALYFIDHGAALYFHHNWENVEALAATPFRPIRNHVLLPWAEQLEWADQTSRPLLTESVLEAIVNLVPADWLLPDAEAGQAEERRSAYLRYFVDRVRSASQFVAEAMQARATLV
jgi:hypothetical protein